MSTTTKSMYLDPSGPLELALLLPETKVFILELICRSYRVKDFALKRLHFQELSGSGELVAKACPYCGGKASLQLSVKSGLASCLHCKKATDLVRLTRASGGCPHLVFALNYLLDYILAGQYKEKERFIGRLEALTKAVYASQIYPQTDGRTVLALLEDKLEREQEGGRL